MTLGNLGYCSHQITRDARFFRSGEIGLKSTANVENMRTSGYWTGAECALDQSTAWLFSNNTVYPDRLSKDREVYAVAVHDGDATAIPQPKALAMMLACSRG